jgi:uncharacterized lipoprotein
MSRARLVSVLSAVALLGLTGCGTKKLNTGKLEGKIKDGIEQQSGVKVKSLSCPSDVKAKKGDTFNCKATTTGGQTATVKVTQKDDKGNVRYSVGG